MNKFELLLNRQYTITQHDSIINELKINLSKGTNTPEYN